MTPHMHFRDVLFLATIVFALGGSESASFLGDEVKEPRKNLPRGLLCGGAFVTTGYILRHGGGADCVAGERRSADCEGIMQAISKSAERVGWFWHWAAGGAADYDQQFGGAWARGWRCRRGCRLWRDSIGICQRRSREFIRSGARLTWRCWCRARCGIIFIFLGQAGTSVYGAYEVLVSMGIITYFIPYLVCVCFAHSFAAGAGGAGGDAGTRRKGRRVYFRDAGIHDDAGDDCVFFDSGGGRAAQDSWRWRKLWG